MGGAAMLPICVCAFDMADDKLLFQKLYTDNLQDMYAVAFAILHNREDAEDAVHQSFLKIADSFARLSRLSGDRLKAYIVVVTRNTAINMYNQNKYHAAHTARLDEELPDLESGFSGDERAELYEAIKMLPQMYKDVLFLYYLECFSSRESAKQLGISLNTFRQRVSRARLMLKKIIEEGGKNE